MCFPLSLIPLTAAEGQMDCLLLLVNKKQSAEIIDSQDTQGQYVTYYFMLLFGIFD